MSVSLSTSDLDAIRHLLKIVTDNNLSELTITLHEGVSITIKTSVAAPAPGFALAPYAPPLPGQQTSPMLAHPVDAPKPTASRGIPVASPMVGIFYLAPTPDDPPYVKVGDIVHVGQIIGLIEAMKVFSEVPSEVAGRVVELAAHNSELVQLGQPLMFLEPAA